jgi:alpha-amylase/alpha-mannosidase (GH57 family)
VSEPAAGADLVFLWHHHQPDYRSPRTGVSVLPWVRLHAAKDYLDMARHLERHPRVHAAFNFVPSLIDQLEAAAEGGDDALFTLLARPVESLSDGEREEVRHRCGAAPPHALERWPRYAALVRRGERARGIAHAAPLGELELLALECWFLLAWLDPTLHSEPEAAEALATGGDFAPGHRDRLLALHARLVREVLPAYRALAERGQIELSASAYYHPILPLLAGHEAARRARPEIRLPAERFEAPEDAVLQVEMALARHARAFGAAPLGMWPPEGAVSPEAAEIVARCGVRWLATDEEVLWKSLPPELRGRESLYRPWQVETPAGSVALLFRDRDLSDRIGFVYQRWGAAEAVADLLGRVRRIAQAAPSGSRPVVCVILDGENCWEGYREDGGPFLSALYSALEESPDIRTRTPSEVLADAGSLATLPTLHSGSWIDADFHIWIGHPEKNRAWDLLARTRRALTAAGSTPESHPDAWESLFAAEGSDWFWWFGDDHFTADRAIFDRLFREHLEAVHERMGWPTPAWLKVPVIPARAQPGATLSPIGLIHPVIDGRRTQFYEWHAAGRFRLGAGGAAAHHGAGKVREIYFGFDREHFYLRIDFASGGAPGAASDLEIELLAPRPVRLRVRGLEPGARVVMREREHGGGVPAAGERAVGGARGGGDGGVGAEGAGVERRDGEGGLPGARCVVGTILEVGVPFASLGLKPGESVELVAHLLEGGQPVETLPDTDLVRFQVPDASFAASMWSA